ncbi:MAG: endonuclease III [Treponema sp.]|nr:endonuclease III [Treponema sp.]
MTLLNDADIKIIMERFKANNPNPQSELKWKNPYTLLVAVVLSAQATDKSVNKATEKLFEKVDSPQKMLDLGIAGLIPYIRSIGLYNNKAKNIIKLSEELIEKFDSKVPDTIKELTSLPGVGRKTANVMLNVAFKKASMPVDTHLLRVSPRIGLSDGKTPLEVEEDLMHCIPEEYLLDAHHWLLLHGRYICVARKPKCTECFIKDICIYKEKNNF